MKIKTLFNGLENKNAFIQQLPDHIKLMIDQNMTYKNYEYWCVDSEKWFLPENRIDRTK